MFEALYAKGTLVENELIRQNLLDFLVKKYEINGGDAIELSEFYSLYNLSEKEVLPTLNHFLLSKIIELSLTHKLAYLTAKGYSLAKPHDVSVQKQGAVNNVTFNAPINGSPIAIGNNNTAILNKGASSQQLVQCIEALRNEIKGLKLAHEEEANKLAVVDQVEGLALVENPNSTVIKMLLNSTLPITANITSLVASISSLLP